MDDGFSSEEIKRIINEIRTSTVSDKKRFFYEKYENFCLKFPKLYMAALDSSFDLRFLDMMLKQRDIIINRTETVEESDKKVYDALSKEYILDKGVTL